MPILRLSNNFSSNIATKVNKIKLAHQNEADLFVRNNEHFNLIYINACQILQKHNFVIIKNIGFNKEKTIFEAFLKMFALTSSIFIPSTQGAETTIVCIF